MRHKKVKKKEKEGSISQAFYRQQDFRAAQVAQERNSGKVSVRINAKTLIMVDPSEVEYTKKKYQLT
jgi:hypothetical protein